MQNRYRLQALGLLVLSGGAAAVAPHALAAPKAAAAVRVSVPVKVAAIPEARIPAKREKRISLDFVGADINDVIKALALQANVNIVTAADVKGLVTVSLNRVSITDALDMVARLSGYQYAKHGPAYVVGTDKSVAALTGGPAPAPAAGTPCAAARGIDGSPRVRKRTIVRRAGARQGRASPAPRMVGLTTQAGRGALAARGRWYTSDV